MKPTSIPVFRGALLGVLLSATGFGAWAQTTYTTGAATNVKSTSATLGGSVTAACAVSGINFQYGLTTAYGNTVASTPATVNTATVAVSANLTSLTCNTLYHYKLTGGLTCPAVTNGTDSTFLTAALGAPTGVSAVDTTPTAATVSWTAPASNCGSAITGYTVTSSPGALTCTTTATACTVTGLTTGTAYTFSVTTTNGNGTGDASTASNSVTPKNTQAITNFIATPSSGIVGGTATLSATPGISANPVVFSSTSSNCAVSGSTVSFTAAGVCALNANQAGTALYKPAPQLSLSVDVSSNGTTIPQLPTVIDGVITPTTIVNLSAGAGPSLTPNMVTILSTVLGTPLQFIAQNAQGVVTLRGFKGGNLAFTPLSFTTGDARADGVYAVGDGQYQLVSGGQSLVLAPALVNLGQLTALLPGVSARQADSGVLTASYNGAFYVVQPGIEVQLDTPTGVARLITGADGQLRFIDAQGNNQVLYPAFDEAASVRSAFQEIDPTSSLSVQLNGTAAVLLNGLSYTAVPDLLMGNSLLGRSWVQVGPLRYLVGSVNSTLTFAKWQGVTFKP